MKYLGIDWGLKRIGLSISEGELASPLTSVEINSLEDGVTKVLKLARSEDVEILVIGKPEGEMGKKVEKAFKLLGRSGLKVEMVDETLSTQKAKSLMIKMGLSKKMRKNDNAISASIILQEYLDNK
ncbi:MAG: Holliday junction resolvase RuvX [Candidatus Daviesbacteria bacterium]